MTPFWRDLPRTLAYPLRSQGLPMLLFFWLVQFIPIVNWWFLLFYAAYLGHILRQSSRDQDHLPDFPPFDTVVEDLLFPLVHLLTTTVLVWSPLLLYLRFTDEAARSPQVLGVLAVASASYFPIALILAVVTRSSWAALDLSSAWRILWRIPLDYAATLVFLAAILIAWSTYRELGGSSEAAAMFGALFRLYLLFLSCHVLGRMVLQTRHVIDWDL